MLDQLTVGCDPELFIRDRMTGLSVSAHGLIPGTKAAPFIVDRGGVQVDGMALEFNTDPARTFAEFNMNITAVLSALRSMLPATLDFDIRPSVVFDDDVMTAAPDEAKELGCDPDFNAYDMGANPRPVPPIAGLRTASGHIHMGLGHFDDYRSAKHFDQMARLVRGMDRFLGTASVIMDPDPVRRTLYGKAGAFRVKPYGCEYRVPSNAWIKSERRRAVMFDLVHRTMRWMLANDVTHDMCDADVRLAIDTSDVAECRSILKFMVEGK